MNSATWLGQLERALRVRVDDIEVSQVDDGGAVTFAVGLRSAIVQVDSEQVHVSPLLAEGGTVGQDLRLEERAAHLLPMTYRLVGNTVIDAAEHIASYLIGEPPRVERQRTLSEIYALTDRLNALTETVNLAHTAARQRFLAIRYHGRPFAGWVPVMRNNDPTEIDYAKDFGEGIAFAHLAVAAKIDDQITNIESRQPPEPDLRVELTDGRHVWVEVTQVTETASTRYFNAIQAVNQHLMRKEGSDPAYLAEVQGRHVAVILPSAPPKNRSREAADEIVALLRSIDFGQVQRRTFIAMPWSVAPSLASLKARYYVGDGISTYVRAQNDANFFNPDDSVDDFNTIVATKTGKAYSVDAPLWLALYLNDLRQVPSLTMAAIRARTLPGTGRFSRIIVGTLVDAEVFDRP